MAEEDDEGVKSQFRAPRAVKKGGAWSFTLIVGPVESAEHPPLACTCPGEIGARPCDASILAEPRSQRRPSTVISNCRIHHDG
jgi:hypothetical protein